MPDTKIPAAAVLLFVMFTALVKFDVVPASSSVPGAGHKALVPSANVGVFCG